MVRRGLRSKFCRAQCLSRGCQSHRAQRYHESEKPCASIGGFHSEARFPSPELPHLVENFSRLASAKEAVLKYSATKNATFPEWGGNNKGLYGGRVQN